MTQQIVKLVSDSKNKRRDLFERIISDLDDYTATKGKKVDYGCNYHIFFNLSGIEKDKSTILAEMFELRNKGLFTIFDISNEDFMKSIDADYYLLFASACSFVTCSSERIQEQLYELTGRLAYLVADPKDALEFMPATWNIGAAGPKVLWFGETKDVMSVRPYLTGNPYNIRVAAPSFLSNTKDRASVALLNNDKKRKQELEDADVVFLPPTFTREGELRRYKKVEESIIAGCFVIAPRLEYDWEELAFQGELDDGMEFFRNHKSEISDTITNKQDVLKTKYSVDSIRESVKSSLELATEEPIFADAIGPDSEGFFIS